MQVRELYQQILGIQSFWSVKDVSLGREPSEVRAKVDHACCAKFCGPGNQAGLACLDHAEERRRMRSGSCQFRTILVSRVPRVKCHEHWVNSSGVSWIGKHRRYRLISARFAKEVTQWLRKPAFQNALVSKFSSLKPS